MLDPIWGEDQEAKTLQGLPKQFLGNGYFLPRQIMEDESEKNMDNLWIIYG